MRIAFILPSLANLGPIIIAKQLISNLVENHQVDVFYFDNKKELEFPTSTFQIGFFDKINFQNYDIVHSHMLRPDLYILYHNSKIPNSTKKISTIHQESFKALRMEYNSFLAFFTLKIWNLALKSFTKVVALNKTISAQLPLKNERICVIGNGISIPHDIHSLIEEKEEKKIKEFKKKYKTILGSSSLLINRKGLDQVIKILPSFPNVGYILVGDGPEKEKLTDLALNLNVLDQCLFLGQKLKGYQYFKYFDVYMLPSHSEGFPICAIEAAREGLPIISSDIPVLREIFKEEEVSFFQLGSSASMKEALSTTLENMENYSTIIFEKYHRELSDVKMAEKYEDLYREIQG